jgi:hypothetical protein
VHIEMVMQVSAAQTYMLAMAMPPAVPKPPARRRLAMFEPAAPWRCASRTAIAAAAAACCCRDAGCGLTAAWLLTPQCCCWPPLWRAALSVEPGTALLLPLLLLPPPPALLPPARPATLALQSTLRARVPQLGHSMAVAAFLPLLLVFSSASGSRRRLPNSRFMGECGFCAPG